MTLPREVIPGRFYMITRRCTQRQFLMRPDAATNNAFWYCVGVAAKKYDIDILLPSAMSNHHHTNIFDRHGHVALFTEHLHKLFAKSQNARLGRWENFWSSEQVCVVHLVDREAVLDKLVYAATNPVKDGLVERVHHWPGVNGLSTLLNDRPMCAHRPKHFFRQGGRMPKTVTLNLVIPPELGDPAEVRRELRERVANVEAEMAAHRRRTGQRVLGRRAILRQNPRACPVTVEPRRNLRPTIATRSKWARFEAIQRNREFVAAYRQARARWLLNEPVTFPVGTYWLRRNSTVAIAHADSQPPLSDTPH